jgi:hypothetical protein
MIMSTKSLNAVYYCNLNNKSQGFFYIDNLKESFIVYNSKKVSLQAK